MTIDNPTSQPSGDEFRETFDLVDRTIEQVTDQHIENQLMKLLSTEYGIEPGSPAADWVALDRVAEFEQHEASEFEQTFSYQLEIERLACQLRAAQADLAAAEARVAAAQHHAHEEMARARFFTKKAAAAQKNVDSLSDVALQRSQEIIDDAKRDARELVVTAERKAAELVAEAQKAVAQTVTTSHDRDTVDGRAEWAGHVVYFTPATGMLQFEGIDEEAGLWTGVDSQLPVVTPEGRLGVVYLGRTSAIAQRWREITYAPRHLDGLSCSSPATHLRQAAIGLSCSSPATAHLRQAAIALEKLARYCQEDQEDETRRLASVTEPATLAERVYEDLRARNAARDDPAETVVQICDDAEQAGQDQDQPQKGLYRATASVSDCRT
jgi:hypothetical protein